MGNQQVTDYEIGWLAGIIDGEGYIGMIICNDNRRVENLSIDVQLHISNTDEEIILKAQSIMRKIGLNPYIRASKGNGKKKDIFRIMVKHLSKMRKLLKVIIPFLTGSKKERAQYVYEFCGLRLANFGIKNPNIGNGKRGAGRLYPYTEQELELYDKCHPIQKSGTSETIRKAQRKNSEIWKVMKERELNNLQTAIC